MPYLSLATSASSFRQDIRHLRRSRGVVHPLLALQVALGLLTSAVLVGAREREEKYITLFQPHRADPGAVPGPMSGHP